MLAADDKARTPGGLRRPTGEAADVGELRGSVSPPAAPASGSGICTLSSGAVAVVASPGKLWQANLVDTSSTRGMAVMEESRHVADVERE